MQTALFASGTAVRSAAPAAPCARRSVVVRASAEDVPRRAMLASLAAGLGLAMSVLPANAIDVFDDRKAREKGYDIIYEARDLDLPQSVRDGFTQARQSLDDTKKRVAESAKRVDITDLVGKKYWTKAREELRGQVGTLRFDLNTLASKLDKTSKKSANKLKDTFLARVDDLDYAIRKKDEGKAQEALAATKSALSDILAAVA